MMTDWGRSKTAVRREAPRYKGGPPGLVAALAGDTEVTVYGLDATTVWGPTTVNRAFTLARVKKMIAVSIGKSSDVFQLVYGTSRPKASMRLDQVCTDRNKTLEFTLVFSPVMPEHAVVVGDLSVWPYIDKSDTCSHMIWTQETKQVFGVNMVTFEVFAHTLTIGRSHIHMDLKLGNTGLVYYSGLGDATIQLSTYNEGHSWGLLAAASDEDGYEIESDDSDDYLVSRECVHFKKGGELVEASFAFVDKLFTSAGHDPPSRTDRGQARASWRRLAVDLQLMTEGEEVMQWADFFT
eukprot:TRINITY_DN25390_c0_g1_i1.p1 TRINITY_DN25390_c0_g1~~TRINITY_DN25390_c0_g1_i1.p1  ORF type:complete len:295 (-),score=28.12 TRINITY_DN25390_c0_g1_i1:341-1225(-)